MVVGLLGGPRDAGVASLEIAGVLGLARGRHRDQVGFLRDLDHWDQRHRPAMLDSL